MNIKVYLSLRIVNVFGAIHATTPISLSINTCFFASVHLNIDAFNFLQVFGITSTNKSPGYIWKQPFPHCFSELVDGI